MDKKIDLDAKNNSTQNTIKIRPNSRNKITLNLQNLSVGKKRLNINNPIRQNITKQQRTINYYRNNNSSQNSQDENLYDEDDLENDDLEDEDVESNIDESDEPTENVENEEKSKPKTDDIKERIIDDAKQELKNKSTNKLKKHAFNKAKREAAKKALAKKTAAKAAGTAAKAATSAGTTAAAAGATAATTAAAAGGAATAAAGTAAVSGVITIGTVSIPIIIPIMLVLIVVSIILAIVGASTAPVSKYGQTCPIIIVIDTDCDDTGQNCTNRYNSDVDLETYIAGVVAANAGHTNNPEYYKTTAILARTYLQKNIGDNCAVQGNNNFQEYIDVDEHVYAAEIKHAVSDTISMVLVINDEIFDINSQQGNTKWKINEQQALSLINNNNYSYEQVITHYFGNDVKIMSNTVLLNGLNGFVNPLSQIICKSPYGYREIHPVTGEKNKFHGGIDLGTNLQYKPIYAAKSGIVKKVLKSVTEINAQKSKPENGGGYGNYVLIDHGEGVVTMYAHIKYGSIPNSIEVGAPVSQGQQIGLTGTTGRSTGIHLHYEVRVNDQKVDPADYLELNNAFQTEYCRK